MRSLIEKTPPGRDRLDINEAIREVIDLTHGEVVKNGVSVKSELANGLPLVATTNETGAIVGRI